MVARHQKVRQPNSTVSSKTITERLTKPQLERWRGNEKRLFLKRFWYPTMWSSNFFGNTPVARSTCQRLTGMRLSQPSVRHHPILRNQSQANRDPIGSEGSKPTSPRTVEASVDWYGDPRHGLVRHPRLGIYPRPIQPEIPLPVANRQHPRSLYSPEYYQCYPKPTGLKWNL